MLYYTIQMHSLRRLICGLFLFFALIVFSAAEEALPAPALNVEELRTRFANEAKAEIASFSLGAAEVSLSVSGFWKGSLQSSLGFAITPIGTNAVSPDSPVLFMQEADLTLDLWIIDKWFVEASVLDNLDNWTFNTYRAGYSGFPGEIVQYAGIGNIGLDFPVFPYLDLGGDSPSSFGFYGHFSGGPFNFHALFRWDQAAREERTFIGGRERSFTYLSPRNYERARSFVLPDTYIDSPPQVYVEDEKGGLRDEYNRRWRLLGPSEYSAGGVSGLVEISQSRQEGMVAVSYSKATDRQPWNLSLGSYGNPQAALPGSGFLGEVQNYFGADYALINYPQCGEISSVPDTPGSRTINGMPVLILSEPGTFSPFERVSRYAAPSSAVAEAAIVRLPGLQRLNGFELVSFEPSSINADIPLYAETEITRRYFVLVREGGTDTRSPQARWPLAVEYPGIYLPGSSPAGDEICIRWTNYGSIGSYSIGTDVVPGSVQVWRSGIIDPNIAYNASSGNVILANPAGFNELIRITYLKRSSETKSGSIAAGMGAQYHKDNSPFSSELALGLRWNLNPGDTWTEEGVSNPGTAGLSAKTAWDFDKFKAQITAGVNFEQPDSTGLYHAAGMEGNEITIRLPSENSFISHPPESASASLLFSGLDNSNRADLIYRTYRDSAALGNTLMDIKWGGSGIINNENRPYPVRDSVLTNKANVLAAEFSLNYDNTWTGFEISLGDDAQILARAKEIEIPYRFYGFNIDPPSDFKVVVQIGSLAGKDFHFIENPALIYENLLYDANWVSSPPPVPMPDNPANFSSEARIARFILRDEDRLKLGNAQYMRIIAVRTGTENISGRILFAPPIVRGSTFRPVIIRGNNVYDASLPGMGAEVLTNEIPDSGANSLASKYKDIIKRLHPDGKKQNVLSVKWEDMGTGDAAGADGRTGSLPLSNYRVLSFFIRGPAQNNGGAFSDGLGETAGTMRIIIAQGPSSLNKPNEQYIEAEIPLSAFEPGNWSKVSIRYQGEDQGIRVNEKIVSEAFFKYRKQPIILTSDLPAGTATWTAVYINPVPLKIAAQSMDGGQLRAGTFCLDEIILEEPAPLYRFNSGLMAEYRLPGTLVAIKKTPVLADLNLSTALESEVHGDPFTQERGTGGGVISRSNAGISVFGVRINGNLAINASPDYFNWAAGHEVSRAIGPFQASESFSAAPADNTLNHRFSIGFFKIFRSRFNAGVSREQGRQERKWNLVMGVEPPAPKNQNRKQTFIPSLAIDTSAAWTSKNDPAGEDNYGRLWAQSWRPMLPDLGKGEGARETKSLIVISEKTKPIGATLTLEGNTGFIKNIETTRSGNIVRLELPVDIQTLLVHIKMERGFKIQERFCGNDILDDGRKFGEGIRASLPLWGVFPFYSIFSPDLNKAMDKGLNEPSVTYIAERTQFNDFFGISGQFPSFYDMRAFIIPSHAAVNFERVLEQKMDTRLDILFLRGNLGFSAINMFGAFGYKPLFKFYQSDEYSSIFETSIAIPADEELSYRVQWSLGAAFRGFTGAELGVSNTVTIASSGYVENLSINWSIPRQKSLLGILYNLAAKGAASQSSLAGLSALMNNPHEQLYKESLDMTIDHSGDYLTWNIALSHESIVRIVGRFNFSLFAKLNFTQSELTKTMSFIGTVGTTLNIMF